MRILRFILTRVLPLAVLLVVLLLAGGIWWLYSGVPSLEGDIAAPGLEAPVTIRYDAYAKPYVEAETLADAFYAQGWLHATHRLFQMDMLRRAGTGRLSALLGGSMLDTDKELYRLGVPQLGQTLEANAGEKLKNLVNHYVAGVNAGIDALPMKPLEYFLLGGAPEVWTTRDVFALGAIMAYQSANNFENELLRHALFEALGPERAAVFIPDDANREGHPYVMPPRATGDTAGILQTLARLDAADPAHVAGLPSFALGSNGWAIAPERSATGDALFAFDSHDSFGVPNLFYEVHLFFENGKQIRGWSVAGLPGVINGYNERIAWGFTNIGDTQDLFIETRAEDDPLQFKDGDTWYRAEEETVEIPVKGRAEPERYTIVHTKNGPLISEDPPMALRWTIQDLGDLGLDALFDLNRAQNWDEFTDALDRFAAPSLNATYADVDGNIGFRTAGLLPLRGTGDGLLPQDGANPDARWRGIVPAADMPELYNPASGYVAAANARVNRMGEGPLVSNDNAPGYRIRRLQHVLASREDFTLDDMRALQMDWHDTQAEILLPTLLRNLDEEELSPISREALDMLDTWQDDLQASPDQAAPLIFQAWYRHLAIEVFAEPLGEELFAELFKNNYPLNHALDHLILRAPESDWWRGERSKILAAALNGAIGELSETLGNDIANWRLDTLHAVLNQHELARAVPQLAPLFNLPPSPWGGGPSTLGRARYRYDRAYNATAGATVRHIGQMTNPPTMEATIPGGQSGHPLSPHYGDQLSAWLNGETLPIAKKPQDVDGTLLTLTPSE